MNYHFKNKPNVTLKNGLWSNCLPPLTIGSSYSNCLCRASGRPFTKAARALPVKLLKATKQYFIIEIHNAGEPLNLFRSYKGFISPKEKKNEHLNSQLEKSMSTMKRKCQHSECLVLVLESHFQGTSHLWHTNPAHLLLWLETTRMEPSHTVQ